jgi:hypothetical protein
MNWRGETLEARRSVTASVTPQAPLSRSTTESASGGLQLTLLHFDRQCAGLLTRCLSLPTHGHASPPVTVLRQQPATGGELKPSCLAKAALAADLCPERACTQKPSPLACQPSAFWFLCCSSFDLLPWGPPIAWALFRRDRDIRLRGRPDVKALQAIWRPKGGIIPRGLAISPFERPKLQDARARIKRGKSHIL